jgi:hypothetical protein
MTERQYVPPGWMEKFGIESHAVTVPYGESVRNAHGLKDLARDVATGFFTMLDEPDDNFNWHLTVFYQNKSDAMMFKLRAGEIVNA